MYRVVVTAFYPLSLDLICRYLDGEAVQAVHRQRARNEGRRVGHGVDFLFTEPQQPALFAAAVARAHPAEERQTRRSQSAGTSWPEDRQYPGDLRERWRRIQTGRARFCRLDDPRRPPLVKLPPQALAMVNQVDSIDPEARSLPCARASPSVSG